MIIRALSGNNFTIDNLSKSNDTVVLDKALQSGETVIDFEDAGTPMRFFLAYAALKDLRVTITGNPGLLARPVKPLVDALSQLGCLISYMDKEGFLPLCIEKGIDTKKNSVSLDASVSSQFASALLLIAPALENGLTIELLGKTTSMPYIDLTIDCMKKAGVTVSVLDDKLVVTSRKYRVEDIIWVEPDWSSATFIYALAAASGNSDIIIRDLKLDSLQGDRVTAYLFEFFGVRTIVEKDGIRLNNSEGAVNKIKVDFTAIPDMFPAVSSICAMLRIKATFTGIRNLAMKESNRLLAMKENLEQTGAILNIENEKQASLIFNEHRNGQYSFKSFNDHRIAMACSAFALHSDIIIDDETVVKKSFPGYWKVLSDLKVIP